MARFTPTTILSEYGAVSALNANFASIATLLEEMLSRNGDGTNSMSVNLDMNHFKVKNLANAVDPTDAVTYGQTIALIDAVTATIAATEVVTPQKFGAKADGVIDDSAAFIAAIAYLHAQAFNTGGSGFYKGSKKLFIPAGNYYLGTTAIDITHSLIIEGEGSGQFGPAAGGCSHLKWADGTDGIRIQAATTEGNTTISGVTHDGAGGAVLRDLCLEGGYAGTEGEHHGLVIRNAIKAENLYIKNFPGEGVKAWAGNINGGSPVSGNVSTTLLVGVKTENNRGGMDFRGSDSNVVTTINCEGYQNRQYGLLDDNGAGSNTHIGWHCASNGMISNIGVYTQCSSGGNKYAARWGGDFTVAPSGTTADTANWYYIESGAVIANLIPAHAATPGLFRAGGDYLSINSSSASFINCYSEVGTFSQFSATSSISEGAIGDAYFRGGIRRNSRTDGYRIRQSPDVALILQHRSTQSAIFAQDELNVNYASITFGKTFGNDYVARDATGHRYYTAPYNGSLTLRASITTNGIELPASHGYYVNSNKVVGARGSAIARITRVATTGSLPTADGSITIANAATPTVVELLEYCTELEAKLEALTAAMRAATGHGLIA